MKRNLNDNGIEITTKLNCNKLKKKQFLYSTTQDSCKHKNKEFILRFLEMKNSIKIFLRKELDGLASQ